MKKNLIKAAVTLALSAALAFSSVSVSAAKTGFTTSDAYSKALKNAGLTKDQVVSVEKDYDDGVFEIEFIKISNGAEYSFEYSSSGKLLEKSVDYNRPRAKGDKKLTKSDAKAKVVKFGGFKKSTVDNGRVWLERDDGEYIYNVVFSTSSYHFEYEVHGRTGKILEYSKEYIGY